MHPNILSFLSPQHKKLIRREYLLRFSTVAFVVLTILGVAAGLFLLPYITFLRLQQQTSDSRLADLSNSSQTKDAQMFRADLNTLRAEALRLEPAKGVMPYELVTELNALVTSGIQLSSIIYSFNSDGSANLSVSGVAATRGSLQAFVSSLQGAQGFTGVSVPVSAFAQDKNINFDLNMTVHYESSH